jgi:hypothetical protein
MFCVSRGMTVCMGRIMGRIGQTPLPRTIFVGSDTARMCSQDSEALGPNSLMDDDTRGIKSTVPALDGRTMEWKGWASAIGHVCKMQIDQ